MAFMGIVSEVETSLMLTPPVPLGRIHKVAAQTTTGTGPFSLCQAHMAAMIDATNATLPHVPAAIATAFDAGAANGKQ